ncbi:NUMOD1 domain-containing DNA-binding protein [Maribacter thermophilus]|uniref:NUMOD1 domain-containing DNA-binding protein n=1 Tax=Maribacter thermophilus TaxID=1197874 RepID=UPI00064181C1|nr:NUMOD1 domain-containing DNA-binding protein [Maribacter thermophilus]
MNSNHIIYKAENIVTGEIYIGATSKSIEERKNDHIQKARNDTGSYFQESIATYGVGSFEWTKIDTAMNLDELAKKEKTYILKYDCFQNGYNSDSGGGMAKTVYQFDILTGKLINSFKNLKSAASAVNAGITTISNACLNYTKTAKGFYWSYCKEDVYSGDFDKRKKKVFQYSLDLDLIAEFKSVSEASRITGNSKTCISRCCRGEREQSGGFLWKYT